MINYKEFTLKNGLRVVVHEDFSSPLAVVNVLYDVGSRDETPDKTGFAHLFEHLMFGGSKNIPSYDTPLQKVGGENNAFTSPDITNYYVILPYKNIETAFWLESDRMMALNFSQKSLEVQQKVVIEEFRQRYLNQPYGDAWLHLRPLAYTQHPYQWATIGKSIEPIENATLEDVKDFFYTHYIPSNAILVVAGHISVKDVEKLAQKWFESIPSPQKKKRILPKEPLQKASRRKVISSNLPMQALYKSYHIGGRLDKNYYATDLVSDILGRGNSSRLYQKLVKEEAIFHSIHAYHTGSFDPGQFIIQGFINTDRTLEEAEEAIEKEVLTLQKNGVLEEELQKTKNQSETALAYSQIELLNKTLSLAVFTVLGDPSKVNQEMDFISKVTVEKVQEVSQKIFLPDNCSTLIYANS